MVRGLLEEGLVTAMSDRVELEPGDRATLRSGREVYVVTVGERESLVHVLSGAGRGQRYWVENDMLDRVGGER